MIGVEDAEDLTLIVNGVVVLVVKLIVSWYEELVVMP